MTRSPKRKRKPSLPVQCADCGAETPKAKSCLWRAGRLSLRLCQGCAGSRLRLIRGLLVRE